jgi:hypothetical protein
LLFCLWNSTGFLQEKKKKKDKKDLEDDADESGRYQRALAAAAGGRRLLSKTNITENLLAFIGGIKRAFAPEPHGNNHNHPHPRTTIPATKCQTSKKHQPQTPLLRELMAPRRAQVLTAPQRKRRRKAR